MKFLWFGKKKGVVEAAVEPELIAMPREVYSVVGYVCDPNPLAGTKNTELEPDFINSLILSLLSMADSQADITAQEFFQEHGANILPISDYAFSSERGFSARVGDAGTQRTILIGSPTAIARVSAPFSAKIAAAAVENADGFIVAIDGIAYASFAIAKELI